MNESISEYAIHKRCRGKRWWIPGPSPWRFPHFIPITWRLQRALDMEGSNTNIGSSNANNSGNYWFKHFGIWWSNIFQNRSFNLSCIPNCACLEWGEPPISHHELQHLMRCPWDPRNWDLLIHFTGLQQIQDDPVSEVKIPWTLRAPSIPS